MTTLLEFLFFVLLFFGTATDSLPSFLSHAKKGLREFDACADYYKGVCDGWDSGRKPPSSEPVWNQFTATTYRISDRMQQLFAEDDFDSEAKVFYAGCVDSDRNYLEEFRVFVSKLGGWNDVEGGAFFKMAEATRLLNIHPILKFTVDVDYTNKSRNMLYIDAGDLVFPELFLSSPNKYSRELKVYRTWITRTLVHVVGEDAFNPEDVDEVIAFEVALAQAQSGKWTKTIAFDENLKKCFKYLLEDTEIDYQQIKEIIVKPRQLKEILDLINATDEIIISNYILWSAIKALARDVDATLRQFSFEVDKAILGVGADLERKHECTLDVLKNFPEDLVAAYGFDASIISDVDEMANNLKLEFVKQLLDNSDWISVELKAQVIRKILSISFEIGYPRQSSPQRNAMLGDNHLINILRVRNSQARASLQQLDKHTKHNKWPISVFDVNAYYGLLQNVVILPLGILHEPFFDPRRSMVANYGSLGSLIGHELSHALDNFLRMDEVLPKVSCFQSKYAEFGTIGENIADNVGLKISYATMVQTSPKTPPFVNHRKAFFENYAKLWCESSGSNDLQLAEEHAPVEMRVAKSLANSVAFNSAYKCARQEKVCSIWN